MSKIIKETVIQERNDSPVDASRKVYVVRQGFSSTLLNLIYLFWGILEALLALRLVLKVLGANMYSPFVFMIYNTTNPFIAPFEGIFRRGVTQGIETASVIEPATITAIVVYPLLMWVVVKIISIVSGTSKSSDETEVEVQ